MQGFSCLVIVVCLLSIGLSVDAQLHRIKLHHFQSVHDQLLEVDSHKLVAFERKYGLAGPIPEGLTNYLDVRQE
ncbi:unnamed protein product [Rotaria magnacalcarata]|uniref:Uncharacterized protein n=1 Tax=Rotaria magnacalcarata TaxID=392030 RepID=A0A816NSD2_9BILA|nr:unnamed protein product [Rotaria magnacalcarata]